MSKDVHKDDTPASQIGSLQLIFCAPKIIFIGATKLSCSFRFLSNWVCYAFIAIDVYVSLFGRVCTNKPLPGKANMFAYLLGDIA